MKLDLERLDRAFLDFIAGLCMTFNVDWENDFED